MEIKNSTFCGPMLCSFQQMNTNAGAVSSGTGFRGPQPPISNNTGYANSNEFQQRSIPQGIITNKATDNRRFVSLDTKDKLVLSEQPDKVTAQLYSTDKGLFVMGMLWYSATHIGPSPVNNNTCKSDTFAHTHMLNFLVFISAVM